MKPIAYKRVGLHDPPLRPPSQSSYGGIRNAQRRPPSGLKPVQSKISKQQLNPHFIKPAMPKPSASSRTSGQSQKRSQPVADMTDSPFGIRQSYSFSKPKILVKNSNKDFPVQKRLTSHGTKVQKQLKPARQVPSFRGPALPPVPKKSYNFNVPGAYEEHHEPQYQCGSCGRSFNQEALAKHSKICKKVFVAKRKEFNSQQTRIVSQEQVKNLRKVNKEIEKSKRTA